MGGWTRKAAINRVSQSIQPLTYGCLETIRDLKILVLIDNTYEVIEAKKQIISIPVSAISRVRF